ncbi:hypothetical protein STCU_01728 [Strigomonas culicis]|uniref:MYND-type domain-containing protein n=1 Tax=Strigomonas culicis TaxID=28005 RepID=S9UZN8_9TRYP|nr:hypothetical protein STCU_09542 [Strigomonas culicis]EPY34243.1 hypothetical protein STCU_01728 [Strigomonas culicis]|eukprot:EPY19286.1 hypothetical protein STCU_09542 [Strigomonas culicis]
MSAAKKNSADKLPDNEASVFGYPFTEIGIIWWEDYLSTVPKSEHALVMARVMECFMAHTILHEDPFLESAVIVLSGCHLEMIKKGLTSDLLNPFEIQNLIFRMICFTAKFPDNNEKEQKELLKRIEKRLGEIEQASKHPRCRINNETVAPAIHHANKCINALRKERNDTIVYLDTMRALKNLFFAVYEYRVVAQPARPPLRFNTYVCCKGCPCYRRLRSSHTVFLRDVDKAKIIDSIMIVAITEDDTMLRGVAAELMRCHFNGNVIDDPCLDVMANLVHNGLLFRCRAAVFFAINLVCDLQQMQSELKHAQSEGIAALECFIATMLWVRDQVKTMRDVENVVPTINTTVGNAERLCTLIYDRADCMQELGALEGNAKSVFTAIAEPECHLAVHSRDVLYGKPSEMRCNNAKCPKLTNELLKCGGCDTTYYCSTACQKADWEGHKAICLEMESRKADAPKAAFEVQPWALLK